MSPELLPSSGGRSQFTAARLLIEGDTDADGGSIEDIMLDKLLPLSCEGLGAGWGEFRVRTIMKFPIGLKYACLV